MLMILAGLRSWTFAVSDVSMAAFHVRNCRSNQQLMVNQVRSSPPEVEDLRSQHLCMYL